VTATAAQSGAQVEGQEGKAKSETETVKTLTVGRGRARWEADYGTVVKTERLTLAELAALLRESQKVAVRYSFAELEAAEAEERKRLKAAPWYTLTQFSGTRRVSAEATACYAVVLDADRAGATRERLLEALNELGCAYVLATSTSHLVDGQERHRVIVPLAVPVAVTRYAALWQYLSGRLPGVDPGAKDATRLNYLPRVPKGALGHVVICVDNLMWFDASVVPQPEPKAAAVHATAEPLQISRINEEQLHDVRSALAHLALCDGANPAAIWWTEVGYALLSLKEAGCALWLEFCREAGTKDTQADADWWTRHAGVTPQSDFRHLFTMAQNRGWVNPGKGRVPQVPDVADFPVDALGTTQAEHPLEVIETQRKPLPKVPGLMINDKRRPLSNTFNAVRAITVLLHGSLYFDEFKSRVMIRWPEVATARPWLDEDATRLQAWLQTFGMTTLSKQSVVDAVELVARQNATNVIVDWLNGLQWDGVRRLSVWLSKTYGTPADRYHMRVGRNMMIAMVARAMQPGCKVDEAMVLEGEQGTRKTQSFEIIGGEYFRELTARSDTKDFEQQLRGVWLGEFSELATIKRPEDIERVKQFMTCRVDHYRPTYGRVEVDMPRRVVFCGSTNREQWAHDPTGARRFNPVKVAKVDLDWLRANRDQLFAEATVLYKAGRKWWIYPKKETRERQAERIVDDPWEDKIALFLRGKREILGASEVVERALGLCARDQTQAHLTRVGIILRRYGCVLHRRRVDGRVVRVWLVPNRLADQAGSSDGRISADDDVSDLLGNIEGAA
jgi:predicted P-loop ATPase